jgi:hypothetical protein
MASSGPSAPVARDSYLNDATSRRCRSPGVGILAHIVVDVQSLGNNGPFDTGRDRGHAARAT